jgi:hypothetical protein
VLKLAAETAAEIAPWLRFVRLAWKLRRNLRLVLALLAARRNPRRNRPGPAARPAETTPRRNCLAHTTIHPHGAIAYPYLTHYSIWRHDILLRFRDPVNPL